jgi:hypothetical protein
MADDKTIQLAINTIRTLSIDAVRHRVTLLVGYGDRQCAVRSASLCLFTSNAACSPSDFGPIRRPLATARFSTNRLKFRPGLRFSFRT